MNMKNNLERNRAGGLFGVSAVAIALATGAVADEELMNSMREAAVAHVERAAEHYRTVGYDQAATDFNDLENEEWVYQPYNLHLGGIRIADGYYWADNAFPELVGMDIRDVYDANGFASGQVAAETASDTDVNLFDIVFPSPSTGTIQPGVGACLKVDPENVVCAWTQAND